MPKAARTSLTNVKAAASAASKAVAVAKASADQAHKSAEAAATGAQVATEQLEAARRDPRFVACRSMHFNLLVRRMQSGQVISGRPHFLEITLR